MEYDYGGRGGYGHGRDGIMDRGPDGRFLNPERYVDGIGGLDGFRRDGILNGPDFGRERFGGGGVMDPNYRPDGFGGIGREGYGGGGRLEPGYNNPGYVPQVPGPVINVFPPQQPGMNGYGNGIDTFTCPMGEGYTPYCPMPGDDPWHTNCCTSFFFGEPTCCYFGISAGKIIFIIFCLIIVIATFVCFWRAVQPSPKRTPSQAGDPARRDGENLLYLDNEPRRNERKVSFRN
uniref:EGF-like domain-containing protein n=1 Tax=Panagrellus redivivus TaxID=6233 RepID=A0A7E4V1G0_PANRE